MPQEEFAKILGVHKNTLGRFERGEGKPNIEELQKILSAFPNINPTWLLTGEGPMTRGEQPPLSADHGAQYAAKEDLDTNYVMVPRYDVKASAGGGAVIHSEQIVDHLVFKSEWVRNALGVSVKDLALISVKGDSMEPALSNGDLILIDLSTNRVEDNAIYVLQLNGTLLVKRIQRKLDGSVVVKSDNQVYEPEVITSEAVDQLRVIGRVVWCGRRM